MRILYPICLALCFCSCKPNDQPTPFNNIQTERLLSNDSTKIWSQISYAINGEEFSPSCEQQQITFIKSDDARQVVMQNADNCMADTLLWTIHPTNTVLAADSLLLLTDTSSITWHIERLTSLYATFRYSKGDQTIVESYQHQSE